MEEFSQKLQSQIIGAVITAGAVALLVAIGKIYLEKGIFALVRFLKHGPKKKPQTASDSAEENAILDAPPACPKCGKAMTKRTARQGANAGSRFWGCRSFPSCRGTRAIS